jgi:hypothetical protein
MSLLVIAACRDSNAQGGAADSAKVDSAGITRRDTLAGYVVARPEVDSARADTARGGKDSSRLLADSNRVSVDSIGIGADTAALRSDVARADVSPPTLSVRMAPGRPKKDSLALIYALRAANKQSGWPVRGPALAPGAILPQKRIVAFYGNPLSKRMGILGEIPPDKMLAKLDSVVAQWHAADPETPVQPALHLVAVVAQEGPGSDGKYRLRMDSAFVENVYGWAQRRDALLFLDIQAGMSTVQAEIPRLMKFLERPNVHLAIDPEFYMHYGKEGVPPGKKIGTLSATEINHAIDQLAKLVMEKNLPPKVLVVHRFTRPMVRGAGEIKLDPRVQVVIDMDGWGAPWLKFDSYKDYVVSEPVQYTGFKLFYRNDTKKGDKLLTPMEVLQLKPRPSYIQYQ